MQTSENREASRLGPAGPKVRRSCPRWAQDKQKSGINYVYNVYLHMNELIFGNKRFDVDDVDNIIIDDVRYGQSLWINFQENFRSLHGRRYEQVQVNFRDSNTLALAAISSNRTRFWNAVVVFSSKLMKTLILPQFDGSQMIAHIMLDSISPCCLPLFAISHHSLWRVSSTVPHKFHTRAKGYAFSTTI